MIKVLKKRSKSQIDLNLMKSGYDPRNDLKNKLDVKIRQNKSKICKINSGDNLDCSCSRMSGGSSLSIFSIKEKNYEHCNNLIDELKQKLEENPGENQFDIDEYLKSDFKSYLKEKEELKRQKLKKQEYFKNILLDQINQKKEKIKKNFNSRISEEIQINNIINKVISLEDEKEKMENFKKLKKVKEDLDFQNQLIEAKRKNEINYLKEAEKEEGINTFEVVNNILLKLKEDKILSNKKQSIIQKYRNELKAELEMKAKNLIESQFTERLLDKYTVQENYLLEKKNFKNLEKPKKNGKKQFVNNSVNESSPIFSCLGKSTVL